MRTERVPGGQVWMLEVVGRRTCHGESFHHSPRTDVGGDRECDDFFGLHLVERKIERRLCSFCCVAAPPEFRRQPPADFDARGEVCGIRGDAHTDEPGKVGGAADFDCPLAEAVAMEMVGDSRRQAIAFGSIEEFRQEFHDPWVGVQGGKRRQVCFPPGAERQPFCG